MSTRKMSSAILAVLTVLVVQCAFSDEWIAGSYQPPAEDDYEAFFADAPAPVLSRTFAVPQDVRRAELKLAVAGLCDIYVNGTRITATPLSAWTDYDTRILEDSYDLMPHVRPGRENEIRLEVGNGWYNPLPWKMWGNLNLRRHLAVGTPCVKGAIEVERGDGAVNTISTDANWRAADGTMVFNSIYRGEKRDFRRNGLQWTPARVVEGPKGMVLPRGDFPQVVIVERLKPRSITRQGGGRFLVDFGVNIAGTIRLVLRDTTNGQHVVCRYGESLWSDGTLNPLSAVCGNIKDPSQKPHGVAEQMDECVCRAAAELVFEPRFTFHAFRYVEIGGVQDGFGGNDIEACAWSADVKTRGSFECSNEKLNKLHEVCLRTFRNNLQSVQSDCPGREKFGYGGDIAATAESFCLNYDMAAFYRKTVRDFLDAARPDGWFTECAPFNGIHGGSPKGSSDRAGPIGWAVAVPILLDALVRYDGDIDIVREAYPALKRYIELLEGVWPGGLADNCLGDWLAVTPPWRTTSGTAHYYQFVSLTASLARRIGEMGDAARYGSLAAKIAEGFRAKHVNAYGVYWPGCMSAQAFGVYHSGLLTPHQRRVAYRTMKEELAALGYFNTAGLFGTQYLLEVLSANDDMESAGRVVLNDRAPGWMRMLELGATTLWETWYGTSGSGSLDHPMFGSVEQWFYRHLLGIQIADDAIGCDKVRIDPKPCSGVIWAKGHLDTPRGRIFVSWHLDDNGRMVKSTILPDSSSKAPPPGVEQGCLTAVGPGGIPLPTVRLENFRDGLEDYAYVSLLKEKIAAWERGGSTCGDGKGVCERLSRAKALVAVPPALVKSLDCFSDDPAVLYAWRDAMADLIEE